MIRVLSGSLIVSAWILAATAANSILIARALGPDGRGAYAAIALWPIVLAGVGNIGIVEALSYLSARPASQPTRVLLSGLLLLVPLSVLLAVGGALAMPTILGHYGRDAVMLAQIAMSTIPLNLCASAFGAVALGTNRIATFNLLRAVVPTSVCVGTVVLFALGEVTLPRLVIVLVVTSVLTFIAGGIASLQLLRDATRPPASLAREIMRYGISVHVGVLATAMNAQLDQLLMSMLIAPIVLGEYATAVSLSNAIGIGAGVIVIAGFPRIAAATDGRVQLDFLARMLRAGTALTAAMALLLYVTAPMLIQLLFGARFAGTVSPARVLAFAAVPLAMSTILVGGFRAMGKPIVASQAQFVSLIATVGLLALLLPRLGALGAAWASLAAYTCSAVFLLGALHRRFDIGLASFLWPRPEDWTWAQQQLARQLFSGQSASSRPR